MIGRRLFTSLLLVLSLFGLSSCGTDGLTAPGAPAQPSLLLGNNGGLLGTGIGTGPGDLAFAPEEPVLVHLLGLASLYEELTEPPGDEPPLPPRAAVERIAAIGAALSPPLLEAFRRSAPEFVAA